MNNNTELILSEIWIYPVKSLGGIKLDKVHVLTKGLEYDRRWMLVDENGNFMSQRTTPEMALFKVSISETELEIRFKNHTIQIPLKYTNPTKFTEVKIWDDTVLVQEVSKEHNYWFSKHLGKTCKLVFFPETHQRLVDPNYVPQETHTSLSDGYPILLAGQSALDDLNSKLLNPVPMNRFRPNLVFSGGIPFFEDNWKEFNIGNINFKVVKPCARCVLTTVDQDTALKSAEPLKTLASFRTKNNKVYFGQNVVAENWGFIQIGDKINIIK